MISVLLVVFFVLAGKQQKVTPKQKKSFFSNRKTSQFKSGKSAQKIKWPATIKNKRKFEPTKSAHSGTEVTIDGYIRPER